MDNPSHTIPLRRESLVSKYSHYINLCFRQQRNAAPYYKQLLDFLDLGAIHGNSSLQTPKYHEIRKRSRRTNDHVVQSDTIDRAPRTHPCIVVLEGFPSPECISAIGANEMVRPEVFIGHLDFSRTAPSPQRFFELPSLPSDRQNIVHIRLMTMGRTTLGDSKLRSQTGNRLKADERCAAFEQLLFRGKQYGATRFRRVHLHNSQIFSVEQMVSFSVTKRGTEPWCGLFLLDRGRSLKGKHNLPWAGYTGGGRRDPDLIPIIPYNSPLQMSLETADETSTESDFSYLSPYHPVNELSTDDDQDLECLRQDPFIVLSRLMAFSARSFSQVLNYIGEDIEACSAVEEEQLSPGLEQLRFNSALARRIEGFLSEDLHAVEERGVPSWPRTSDTKLEARVSEIQYSLKKNYEYLIHRCDQLARRCEANGTVLVSAAQLLEAQRGISQARQVHDLTRLAFIFIPLSTVATLFGMNVSALKSYPPVWIYFVIAVPLTVICWFGSQVFGNEGQNPMWYRFAKDRMRWAR